jgi:hypothetical protein
MKPLRLFLLISSGAIVSMALSRRIADFRALHKPRKPGLSSNIFPSGATSGQLQKAIDDAKEIQELAALEGLHGYSAVRLDCHGFQLSRDFWRVVAFDKDVERLVIAAYNDLIAAFRTLETENSRLVHDGEDSWIELSPVIGFSDLLDRFRSEVSAIADGRKAAIACGIIAANLRHSGSDHLRLCMIEENGILAGVEVRSIGPQGAVTSTRIDPVTDPRGLAFLPRWSHLFSR